jgi:glutaredoxin
MKRILSSAALVAAALSFQACPPSTPGGANAKAGASPKATAENSVAKSANAVKAEFFVMSQCPYGVTVINAVKEAVDKLGPELDLSVDYIGSAGADGTLTSMHGADEVTGDIVQLCAMKAAPAKYLDMVVCQNKNFRAVAQNWESCAQQAQLPVDQIRTCLNGPEGKELLKASFARAEQRQARGSPTIFVSGKPYNGRRAPTDFLRAFCAEHSAPKPQACQDIPEPPKVNVTLVGDKRCPKCDPKQYVQMLKTHVGNPVIKELDYTEPEGRKLYDALGANPGPLPMVLFDSSLDADKDATGNLARYLRPAGSFRSLQLGGEWNPTCMNDGGCNLEACKNTLACKKETPNTLDVYVMSQCPYGVRALNAMDEVLKNFNGKVNFAVHYIANGTAQSGFKSLHGQPEVDENIRELCAMKIAGKNYKWMDYVLCRNKDISSTKWQDCTGKKFGLEAKQMEQCIAAEGKKLLEQDIKYANALGVGASPTWVANGKFKFSAGDPESIKKSLCEHNKGLKGCDKTLSGSAQAGAVQGNCGK